MEPCGFVRDRHARDAVFSARDWQAVKKGTGRSAGRSWPAHGDHRAGAPIRTRRATIRRDVSTGPRRPFRRRRSSCSPRCLGRAAARSTASATPSADVAAVASPPSTAAPTASPDPATDLRPDRGPGRRRSAGSRPKTPVEPDVLDDAGSRRYIADELRQGQPARGHRRERAAVQGPRACSRPDAVTAPTSTSSCSAARSPASTTPTTRSCSSCRESGDLGPTEKIDLRPRVRPRAPGPELRPEEPGLERGRPGRLRRSPAWRSSRATRRCS